MTNRYRRPPALLFRCEQCQAESYAVNNEPPFRLYCTGTYCGEVVEAIDNPGYIAWKVAAPG
jgi:hypothetical protein